VTKSTLEAEMPAFLTTSQFSRITQLSVATVKRLCDVGEIAHVVVSERGDRRIPATEVERLLAEAQANKVGRS
jgi:excisionase family DNA binding protein